MSASPADDDDASGQFDFDQPFQEKVASMFLRDTTFAMRTKDLVRPEYFTEDAIGSVIAICQEHVKIYKAAPGIKLLPGLLKDAIARKQIRQDMIADVTAFVMKAVHEDLSNMPYVIDKVTDFAKRKAMEQAIFSSVDMLDKGDFASIEKAMKTALAVGANIDGGDYDYWKEIGNRTQRRHDLNAGKLVKRGITTGYAEIDAYLFHNGWGRREISVMMGAAKAGKSMSLGDFSKNASLAGYNVFYAGCEVASWIIAERVDAALSDTMINQLHLDPEQVRKKIEAWATKAAAMKMRDYASGTLKPSQLHRAIESYRADGIVFDLITVDYADIMAAEYRSDKLIDNLREIYIDLRAIGHEFDAAMLTATQTNRSGAMASTAKATDVGDDFNKIRTADIVIGINATDAEKAIGEARLYWAVSRNTEDGFSLRIKQDRSRMQFLTKVIGRE